MAVTAFVTGGSGFVGGAVVRDLARRGMRVRALSRGPDSEGRIAALGGTPVRGDLESASADQLAGAQLVVHAAARVAAWGPVELFHGVNVVGTARLLDAARRAGVRRFVHIGTEAALFDGRPLVDIAEDDRPLAIHSPFAYARTKALAERLVRAADDPETGFRTIVLRPRMIWGPGDRTLLPAIARMAAAGRFVWVDGGRARTNTTHIANLLHAIRLAFSRGKGGRAYFIHDGEIWRMKDFLTCLAATRGIVLPARSLPSSVLRPVAAAVEALWSRFAPDAEPPITRMAVALMAADCVLRLDAARADLGYAPVIPVEEGLAQLTAAGAAPAAG